LSDAFDPPTGDAAGLASSAKLFATVAADLTADSAAASKAVEAAIGAWTAPRAEDFRTACFGIQAQLASEAGALGAVSQALAGYAASFTNTCQEVARLKAQAAGVEQNAERTAAKLSADSAQQDQIFQHSAVRQGQLAQQAIGEKADLSSLAGKLAALIDAETDSLVPGGAALSPDEIRRRVDSALGVSGLTPAIANGTLTSAQAWSVTGSAQIAAEKILDVVADNKDGELVGGPVTSLTTDPAILQLLLDDARNDGIAAPRYAGLLAQYWAVKAAVAAGIDLDAWDPSQGTGGNMSTISAVYTYYGSLFLKNPDLTWAGMANMIGPSFAAGFMDLDMFKTVAQSIADKINSLPGPVKALLPPELEGMADLSNLSGEELQWFEQKFLAMQKHIFFDQGSMHQAYTTLGPRGGLAAIQEMQAAGLIDAKAGNAWQLIASGQPISVQQGNAMLLDREQNQIIFQQYDQMRNHDGAVGEAMTYLMTVVGSASIPGTKTPAQYSPLTFGGDITVSSPIPFVDATVGVHVSTPLPDFNVADKGSRWDYVTNDTLPAYTAFLRDHPEEARNLIASPVGQRIDQQRLANRWPQLADDLLTDWDVSVDGGLSLDLP
jgi:hypothetical protein